MNSELKILAWETTRRCSLNCLHCRASATQHEYAGELTTDEGLKLIDAAARFTKPMLIFTGGDPLSRPDIYTLAAAAAQRGLRPVMAVCGPTVDGGSARRLRESGINRISISIDGTTARSHDSFRGAAGAFDGALRAIGHARDARLEFQINTAVCRLNAAELPQLLMLAEEWEAAAWDVFFLVPTGRGAALRGMELAPPEYLRAMRWLAEAARKSRIKIRTTCAPQYSRVLAETGAAGKTPSSGCMAGRGFIFVSHRGELQPCGFLDLPCGNLRDCGFALDRLYNESPVFLALRDAQKYKGACGHCAYRERCGGCRARAYAATGDFLAEAPDCPFGRADA